MEPPQTALRYQLILGKFPVIKIDKDPFDKLQFVLDVGKKVYMVCTPPPNADVKEGDLLTLYTEVLVHAKSSQS